jgi:hypothetical protein
MVIDDLPAFNAHYFSTTGIVIDGMGCTVGARDGEFQFFDDVFFRQSIDIIVIDRDGILAEIDFKWFSLGLSFHVRWGELWM